MRACASCNGLPTSGRTPCAQAAPWRPRVTRAAATKARRKGVRVISGVLLVEELLGADEADLGHAVALRRRHHVRHVLVRDELVGAQVELGLDGQGRGRL